LANIKAPRQGVPPPIPAVAGKPIYAAAPVPEPEEAIARPERTSPLGLEQYIAGRTLVSGDSPAWNDMFVQVYSRLNKQEPFLVPAVAEPLIVWVMSGEAVVEERDLDGDWVANTVTVGDFFLTRSPTPYEMRWRAIGDVPFQVMHLYLSVR
jgi:AraC family transcriptional regulator